MSKPDEEDGVFSRSNWPYWSVAFNPGPVYAIIWLGWFKIIWRYDWKRWGDPLELKFEPNTDD